MIILPDRSKRPFLTQREIVKHLDFARFGLCFWFICDGLLCSSHSVSFAPSASALPTSPVPSLCLAQVSPLNHQPQPTHSVCPRSFLSGALLALTPCLVLLVFLLLLQRTQSFDLPRQRFVLR